MHFRTFNRNWRRADAGALGKFIALLGWACFLAAVVIFTSQKRGLEAQVQSARAEQEKLVQESVVALRNQTTNAKARAEDKQQRDTDDVYRLRNEVKQLRDAQKDYDQVRAHNADLQNTVSEMRRANAEMQVENNQLKTSRAIAESVSKAQAAAAATVVDPQRMRNACIANLKQIDGATQQWALEYKKVSTSPVVVSEVVQFLKDGRLPVCPAGGVYSVGARVQDVPRCTIAGHSLQ